MRRLNGALREQEVPRTIYVNWVRESIVKEVLAQRPGKVRVTVPPPRRAAVDQITAPGWRRSAPRSTTSWATSPTSSRSGPTTKDSWVDPDQADPEAVAEAAIEALAHVLTRVGRTPVTDEDTGAVARLTRMLRS